MSLVTAFLGVILIVVIAAVAYIIIRAVSLRDTTDSSISTVAKLDERGNTKIDGHVKSKDSK